MSSDLVATFEHDGDTYEIGHLIYCAPDNFGSYVVFRDGRMVGSFCRRAPWANSRDHPLPDETELVALAQAAIAWGESRGRGQS